MYFEDSDIGTYGTYLEIFGKLRSSSFQQDTPAVAMISATPWLGWLSAEMESGLKSKSSRRRESCNRKGGCERQRGVSLKLFWEGVDRQLVTNKDILRAHLHHVLI